MASRLNASTTVNLAKGLLKDFRGENAARSVALSSIGKSCQITRNYSTTQVSNNQPNHDSDIKLMQEKVQLLRNNIKQFRVNKAWEVFTEIHESFDQKQRHAETKLATPLTSNDYQRLLRLANLKKLQWYNKQTINEYVTMMAEIVGRMGQAGYILNTASVNHMLAFFGRTKTIDMVEQVWQQAVLNGVELDVNSYNNLINAYINTNNYKKVWETWDAMKEEGIRSNTFTFNALIRLHGNSGDTKAAIETFQLMQQSTHVMSLAAKGSRGNSTSTGIARPNVHTHNAIIEALGRNNKLEEAAKHFDTYILGPTQMARLQKLSLPTISNGKRVLPNIDTFHALIKYHAAEGKTEEAQAYLQMMTSECYSSFIKPTEQTFKLILNRKVATKDFEFAVDIAAWMKDNLGLKPVASMVNSLERAWDSLQERADIQLRTQQAQNNSRAVFQNQIYGENCMGSSAAAWSTVNAADGQVAEESK